jgi:hypothetical protein
MIDKKVIVVHEVDGGPDILQMVPDWPDLEEDE